MLIYDAKIYLFDVHDTTANAIVIKDGRIDAVGSEDELRSHAGKTETLDARGATILPGLIDTHPHLLHFAVRRAALVDIADAISHADIVQRIADRARCTPMGEWIMTTPVGEAHYFIRRSYRDLKESELPNRYVLDRGSDAHPVIIAAWEPNIPNVMAFNSMALQRLGITREHPERVEGIIIEKDAQGEPTGRLVGAVNATYSGNQFAYGLWRKLPIDHSKIPLPAIKQAIDHHHSMGVTGIYENHMMHRHHIDAYRHLREAQELKMRVTVSQESESFGNAWSRSRDPDKFIQGLEQAASSIVLNDDYLRFNGISIQWDGNFYPGFTMMRDAYYGPNGEETCGRYAMDPKKIETAMQFCTARRIRLNTLCVGTQANEENLRMLEQLALTHDFRPLRWILVHTPFIEPGQVNRYFRLGFDVTTTMTYLFGMGDLFRRRLKPDLREQVLRDLLPLRRFFDAGMAVTGGTDWGPKSVFEHIQLALTHRMPSGYSNLGPSQQISRTQAVAMWTREAARLLQWPDIGHLSPGAHADLVILDRDPLDCDIEEIANVKVLRTVFGGKVAYDTGML